MSSSAPGNANLNARPNQPLMVICAVGLCQQHLGEHTPTLSGLAKSGGAMPMAPALPAVTTTGQASMLSGAQADAHGIVGNGWLFRDLGEVWFWRQSEQLMQHPPLWEGATRGGKAISVLKHFWWYAMNSSADHLVTPRPVYHHDGRKSPDIYASSPELKALLIERHGTFPLFNFWGPMADIRSTRWIAESFTTACDYAQADLNLCYLPHLDYDLQRFGPEGPHLAPALKELDDRVAIIVDHATQRGAQVLVVSEYGIEAVDRAVFINRTLREAGLLNCSFNAAGELLDTGTSRALPCATIKSPMSTSATRRILPRSRTYSAGCRTSTGCTPAPSAVSSTWITRAAAISCAWLPKAPGLPMTIGWRIPVSRTSPTALKSIKNLATTRGWKTAGRQGAIKEETGHALPA